MTDKRWTNLRTRLTAAVSAFTLAGAALSLTAPSAGAFEIFKRGIWPTPSAELGAPIWTGATLRPSLGYDSFEFDGTASSSFDDVSGFSVGGQVGYDYAITNRIVIGAIADGSFNFADDTGTGAFSGVEADLQAVGSIRGRLGFTFDRFLVYGTGGVAFARLEVSGAAGSQTETLTGWVAGGGVEYMWWPNTSLRVEYNYSDYGDESFSALNGGSLGIEGGQFDIGFIRRF